MYQHESAIGIHISPIWGPFLIKSKKVINSRETVSKGYQSYLDSGIGCLANSGNMICSRILPQTIILHLFLCPDRVRFLHKPILRYVGSIIYQDHISCQYRVLSFLYLKNKTSQDILTNATRPFCFCCLFWLPHTACRILVPWPRTEPWAAAVEVVNPNQWTARELPKQMF